MKFLVCVKHVPHTETKIKPGSDGKSIDGAGVKWVMSPYDEFAVEEALQRKQAAGEGEVVVVCAGRADAQATLRQALAMGADRAIHVVDEQIEQADGLTRAQVLAAVAREEAPNAILTGKYGVGLDDNQTGPMLAELLDWPHSGAISALELTAGGYTAQRQVEGAVEVQEGSLPAVLTCDKGLNEPRYASLKGIMQAKKKPIEQKSAADLGVEVTADRLVWEALELPPARGDGKILDGAPADAAGELARLLREEAKVI